ncbi:MULTISPECIES: hypothetical protein [unclassified Streptomyces]|uniref:hypothetical protein n=1 Tax=unclassified Streptomyces TaxID=2593676 RepID=UPI00331792B0
MYDDTLTQFEYETEPFTAVELEAIFDFRKATEGFRDSLEPYEPKELVALGAAYGAKGVQSLISDHANCLNSWYLALDTLLASLLTCTAESTHYSTAAGRYLKAEASAYHHARQTFEHAVTVFLLGRQTGPLGNYPPPTNSLNLAMQCLDTAD